MLHRYTEGLHASQSVGDLKVLFFLISFPDDEAQTRISSENAQEIIFGDGSVSMNSPYNATSPFESLTKYYERASYGKLDISGSVFGWYKTQNTKAHYDRYGGLMEEVIAFYDPFIDYSQFDGDLDGVIDSVVLHYSQGSGRSFSSIYGAVPPNNENMKVNRYIVMYDGAGYLPSNLSYYMSVLTHEMGHNIGTKDTYDSAGTSTFNIGEGINHSELMNNAIWDFASLHKILFEWMDNIQIIGPNQSRKIQLSSYSLQDEVLIIFPYENNLDEFFLVEYLTPHNNLIKMFYPASKPETGLRIFRVNLSQGIINRNNAGSFKSIESVLNGTYGALLEDEYYSRIQLFNEDDELTPNSFPSSFMYDLDLMTNKAIAKYSGVSIKNIRLLEDNMIEFDVSTQNIEPLNPFSISISEIGNYIELNSNVEFQPTYSEDAYLTDGINSLPLIFEKQTWYADDFGVRKLRLVVTEDVHTFFELNNLKLVIPAGTFRSSQNQFNPNLEFKVAKENFPAKIIHVNTNDLENVINYLKVNDTDVAVFYYRRVSQNIYDFYFDLVNKDGVITSRIIDFNLNSTLNNQIFARDVLRMKSGNYAFLLYDFTLSMFRVHFLSPTGDVIKIVEIPVNYDKGMTQLIEYGDSVLFRTFDGDDRTKNWDVWQLFEDSDPIIHRNLPILGIDHDQSSIPIGAKNNFYKISEDRWIVCDAYSSNSFTIIDGEFNVIKTRFEDRYNGRLISIKERTFVVDYKLLDDGNIARIIAKYNFEREKDYYVQYFDSNLNFIYEKLFFSSGAMHDANKMARLVEIDGGYLLSSIELPNSNFSANAPYTKTLFLDEQFNVMSVHTDKRSDKGTSTTFLSMSNHLFAGSRFDYGFSDNFTFPSSTNRINIVPSQVSEHETKLTFDGNFDKIEIFRSLDSRNDFELVGLSFTNEYIDVVPSNERKHFYKAKAYNLIDSEYVLESESSIVVGITNGSSPGNLNVFRPTSTTDEITWSPQVNVDGYEVFRRAIDSSEYVFVSSVNESHYTYQREMTKSSSNIYSDINLYFYKVRSFTFNGQQKVYSDFSDEKESGIPVNDIVYFHYYNLNNQRLFLQWIGPSGVTRIYRSTNSVDNFELIGSTEDKYFEDYSFDFNETYYYKLETDLVFQNSSRTIESRINKISASDIVDMPIIEGVENHGNYNSDRIITFNSGYVYLNGNSIQSGHSVTQEGIYTLEIMIDIGSITLEFEIDKTAPVITVQDYITTSTDQSITVSVITNEGTLNQDSYTFTRNGSFKFIATDAAGNKSEKVVTITNITGGLEVNTSLIGSGGSIQLYMNGGLVNNDEVVIGGALEIRLVPQSGYRLYELNVNGKKSNVINNTFTITSVNESLDIQAQFLRIGDLNGDGSVTTTDLVTLRRFLAGLANLNEKGQAGADVDGNRSITTTDLVRLRRQLAGLE
jgi:M6 family metalloprotease-like protein